MLTVDEYARLANDLILAFNAHDQAALERLNQQYHRSFTSDDLWAEIWRRVYAFRQRAFKEQKQDLEPAEAQALIAQDAGFASWTVLTHAVATGAPPVPPYAIDTTKDAIAIAPRRQLSDNEWDELIEVMKEREIVVSRV